MWHSNLWSRKKIIDSLHRLIREIEEAPNELEPIQVKLSSALSDTIVAEVDWDEKDRTLSIRLVHPEDADEKKRSFILNSHIKHHLELRVDGLFSVAEPVHPNCEAHFRLSKPSIGQVFIPQKAHMYLQHAFQAAVENGYEWLSWNGRILHIDQGAFVEETPWKDSDL